MQARIWRLNDVQALLREASDDPCTHNALADEVMAQVQSNRLVDRPDPLRR